MKIFNILLIIILIIFVYILLKKNILKENYQDTPASCSASLISWVETTDISGLEEITSADWSDFYALLTREISNANLDNRIFVLDIDALNESDKEIIKNTTNITMNHYINVGNKYFKPQYRWKEGVVKYVCNKLCGPIFIGKEWVRLQEEPDASDSINELSITQALLDTSNALNSVTNNTTYIQLDETNYNDLLGAIDQPITKNTWITRTTDSFELIYFKVATNIEYGRLWKIVDKDQDTINAESNSQILNIDNADNYGLVNTLFSETPEFVYIINYHDSSDCSTSDCNYTTFETSKDLLNTTLERYEDKNIYLSVNSSYYEMQLSDYDNCNNICNIYTDGQFEDNLNQARLRLSSNYIDQQLKNNKDSLDLKDAIVINLLDSLKTELDSNLENVRCPVDVVSKKLVEVLLSEEYVRHSPQNTDDDCHTYDPYVYINSSPSADICSDFEDPEHFEINKSHIYKHINTWYNNDSTAEQDKKWKNNAKKNGEWRWSDYFIADSFGDSKIMTKYELGELIKRYVLDVENIVGQIAKRDRYAQATNSYEIGNEDCKFIRKSTDGGIVTILDSDNNSISQIDTGGSAEFSIDSGVKLITGDGTYDDYINASNPAYKLVTSENIFQLEEDYDVADTITRAGCNTQKATITNNIDAFSDYLCDNGPVPVIDEITALKTKYSNANTYYTTAEGVQQYFTDVQSNTRKLYTSYSNIVFNQVSSLPEPGIDLSTIPQNYIFKFVKVADGNKDYKYYINGGKTLDACNIHGDTYQCINLSDKTHVANSLFTDFPVDQGDDHIFDKIGNVLLTDIHKIRKNDYYEITDSQGTSHYFKVYNITKLDDNLADFSGFIDIANDTETITYDEFINTNIDIKLLDDAISGHDVNLYITKQDSGDDYYYEMDNDSKANLLAFIRNYVNRYDTSQTSWDSALDIDTWDKCVNAPSEQIFAIDQSDDSIPKTTNSPPCSNPYTECVCNPSNTKGQEGIDYGCKTTDIYKPYYHYEQINNLPVERTQASTDQTLEYDWDATRHYVGDGYINTTYNTAYMSKGSDIINKGTNSLYDCKYSSSFIITSQYGLKWKKINPPPSSRPSSGTIYTITQESIDLINKYNTDFTIGFVWGNSTLDFTNYQSMLYFDNNQGGSDISLTTSNINKNDYLEIEDPENSGSYLYYKTNGTNNCDLSQDCYDSTNIISNDYTTKLCNLYNDEQICSSLPSLSTPLNNDFYSKYESCVASPDSLTKSDDCVAIGYPGNHGDSYDNAYSFNAGDCTASEQAGSRVVQDLSM
jgi:hypothetical protein